MYSPHNYGLPSYRYMGLGRDLLDSTMTASPSPPDLDLSTSAAIFILPSHLKSEELHAAEDVIFKLGGALTYDPKEARIFLGKIAQKKRAAFDLRARGVWTEEAALPDNNLGGGLDNGVGDEGPARKKAKLSRNDRDFSVGRSHSRAISVSSSTSSESSQADPAPRPRPFWPDLSDHILILKIGWLDDCVSMGHLVPYTPYVVYTAKVVAKPSTEMTLIGVPRADAPIQAMPGSSTPAPSSRTHLDTAASIFERAKADALTLPSVSSPTASRRRFGDRGRHPNVFTPPKAHPPKLHRTTTSEFEDLSANPLPPLPEWATGPSAMYACCRSTPLDTANAAFIAQLSKIKEARVLNLDNIGVRAYSTAIASISAYPHKIRHRKEITRLPGCEAKIATLWNEWYESAETESERYSPTVRNLDNDVDLQHLRLFYNIWGVGQDTAHKYYFQNGWKDLDDVVESGWATLTRVQQIGVKYYDEFLERIPRGEIEDIRDVIWRHARLVLDVQASQYSTPADVECIVVGGYRRGKEASGDVDVVLSHRDESKTKDLVVDLVRSLEAEEWITHTLTLTTTTSNRDQATLPYRAERRGHGFDSLDKALCVWQNPHFDAPAESSGDADGQRVKNPNIHRRVDIIIAPWRHVGCAVLGWSGGTTFQRDLRRFASDTCGFKFDSSGVRDRKNGLVLDLEAPRPRSAGHGKGKARKAPQTRNATRQKSNSDGPADVDMQGVDDDDDDNGDTWQDRERRLMEGLGIGYRPPGERCTG